MKILFLHGLESGPHGSKYTALVEIFGDVISPDCTGMTDIFERLSFVKKSIKNEDGPFLVVGSSFGGLLALLLQSSDPEIVAGMVLCAPALHQPAAAGLKSGALPPTVIIHGIGDDVVPIDASRSFGAPLIEVEDDHRLSRSLGLILREVFSMKLSLLLMERKDFYEQVQKRNEKKA